MRRATVPPQADAAIWTPDRRLRVFVSSTLRELADERRAAREAIGTLRLTPVRRGPPYRHMIERTERTLRAALGDEAFTLKVSEGTRISLEEALRLAPTLGNETR